MNLESSLTPQDLPSERGEVLQRGYNVQDRESLYPEVRSKYRNLKRPKPLESLNLDSPLTNWWKGSKPPSDRDLWDLEASLSECREGVFRHRLVESSPDAW